MNPIRIAILGAGIFAHEAHAPALLNLSDRFEVVAVYSRQRANAEALAQKFGETVEATDDLDSLLARPDIEAVDVILPINNLPDVVERALRAGKHVISEKPVAPSVEVGRHLLAVPRSSVWMVAENYRYDPMYLEAARLIQAGEIGRVVLANWYAPASLVPSNRYYQTDWRRTSDFQGGFILDGGVHKMAALRLMLGEVASVTAHTAQVREDLPPMDTVSASFRFDSGALASIGLTYAAAPGIDGSLRIFGDRGSLTLGWLSLTLTRDGVSESHSFPNSSIEEELKALADSVRNGAPHQNTPEQALQDVVLIEAMVQSGAENRMITPERFV